MTALVFALIFVVIGVGAYVALRNAQDFSDANEIVPGVPTNAPKEWAGAHSREARMHRRLRDAVAALRANASLDDPSMAGIREDLQEQAVAVDQRLIAAAALPKSRREEPLAKLEEAVSAIEEAAAAVVDLRGPSLESVEQGIEDVRTRIRLVESARAELEAMTPQTPGIDELRRQFDETTGTETGTEPPPPASDPDDGPEGPGQA